MWNKINHGGEPTKNIDKKYAIFVGRYQPYHYGHIELIKQKLNQGIPALIMVRNIEPDERNPFTTEQTVSMIKKYHATPVSYTHLPSPRDKRQSRMPSSA